jgi:hypothetical protein
MRNIKFKLKDGRTMDVDVTPRLEQIVREQHGMDTFERVSDADIKRFFLESLVKAGK